jgi:hypothetical protein
MRSRSRRTTGSCRARSRRTRSRTQALSGFTFNLAELTGPAIAAALVLGLGAGWAFLLDAGTFVVSALMLTRVRTSGTSPGPSERRTLLAELTEGYREVRSRAWLWVTVAVFALAVPRVGVDGVAGPAPGGLSRGRARR